MFEALSLYRSKDIVEKGFGNLNERPNYRRMQVSSELSLNGKLFVEFLALIYLSYVKKQMQNVGCWINGPCKVCWTNWIPLSCLKLQSMNDCQVKSLKNRSNFMFRQVQNHPRYKFRELRLKITTKNLQVFAYKLAGTHCYLKNKRYFFTKTIRFSLNVSETKSVS